MISNYAVIIIVCWHRLMLHWPRTRSLTWNAHL